MGRKIPAKKHRGVKDPLVQQARRLQSLKSKINAPPKDPDEQPVPRSLTQLFAFQNQDKNNDKKNKKKPVKRLLHSKDNNPSGAGRNPLAGMRRAPGESSREFSLRINGALKTLHQPAENLQYPQDMEAEDVKGARIAAQRERRARKKKKAGRDAPEQEPRPTRTQRLALKKNEKKLRALEASKDKQEVVYERVSFGEVCHAPPALPARRNKPGADGAPRPGRRDLLLTKMLAPATTSTGSAGSSKKKNSVTPAEAQRLERARLEAVAAYRAGKAEKLKNQSNKSKLKNITI